MADERPIVLETRERSSGAGWVIAFVLIVALILGVVFFGQMSRSKSAENNAITHAASQVGNAAEKAGNAAHDAAN